MRRDMRAIAAGLLVLAAGCGGGGDDSLTYWRTLTGAAGEAQDELADRYNGSTSGPKVTVQFQGGYSDLASKLMAAAAAGRGPNITQLGTFEIREFAEQGLLADLTPYVEGPNGIDMSVWPGSIAEAGRVGNGLYWLPFNVAVPVLYYNAEAFEEAGLPGPPETWDDFFAYAERLTRRENGRVKRYGVAFWDITWPFVSMIWSEGGELTDREYKNVTLDDPVAIEVMTRVRELVESGAASLPDAASGGHRALFESGRATMILDSPARFTELRERARGFTPKVALYPAGAAGRVLAPGGGGIAMFATAPESDRDAAWAFIKHMLSDASLAYYAEASGYLAFTPGARKAAAGLLDDPAYATLHAALPYIRGDFSVTMEPAVRNAFDEAFQSIALRGADAAEALRRADARAEAALAGSP